VDGARPSGTARRRKTTGAAGFLATLAAAPGEADVDALLHAEAVARGATSVAYVTRTGGARRAWSTADPAWRARYAAEGLGRIDPEMRRGTRPPAPTGLRARDLAAADGTVARFGGTLPDAGFAAWLRLPDESPAGMRDMATINVIVAGADAP
jgi:hypothetical protein